MRLRKILSMVLILLLLASVTVPTTSAGEALPAVFLAPSITEIVVNGVAFSIAGAAVLYIAEQFGKTWDETEKGWNKLLKDTGQELTKLFQSNKMIDATSARAEAILAFDYYTAGSGDKKTDKLYHKAKKEKGKDGKVKINPQRISEDEAVKELREGRDIFAPNKNLAEKLVNRVGKENHKALKLKGEPENQ